MHVNTSLIIRTAGLVAGSALAISGVYASEAAKASGDELPSFDNNFIKLSATASDVSGSISSYQANTQMAKSGVNGIEDLKIGRDLTKDTTFQFDSKILPGPGEYLGKFLLTKTDVGSFEVGYKRFRTFYDGAGGFFPSNNQWLPMSDSRLYTDRASFWFEGKIALPQQPVFRVRYSNDLRNGRKDSTIWGDTDLTGIQVWSLSSLNLISANRKIIPAYMDLNERQQNLLLSLSHVVGKTSFDVELIANRVEMDDCRYSNRYPGELKPYPAIPSSPLVLIDNTLANNPISGFDRQGNSIDTVTISGKVVSELSDRLSVFGGLSYQVANGDISGDREMTLTQRTAVNIVSGIGGFVSGGRPATSYRTTSGTVDLKVGTANLGVDFKPNKNWMVTGAVKAEQQFSQGSNSVTYINTLINATTGVTSDASFTSPNTSRTKEAAWIPELDIRYTGIKRLSLYAKADYRWSPGNEQSTASSVTSSGTAPYAGFTYSADRVRENHGNYKAGANWIVSPKLTLRGETFIKDHANAFDGLASNLGSQYILGYKFKGASLTATWKVLPNLTATTRYVGHYGKVYVTTDSTAKYQSMKADNHMIGETIDWTPTKDSYVQASVNYVYDSTRTSYLRAGGTADLVLHNADNNYYNSHLILGWVVEKDTDAEIQVTHYKADNYQPAQSFATVPYGMTAEQYVVTVGAKYRFTDKVVGSIKVGRYRSINETSGNFSNYTGTLAYVSIARAF